MSTLAVLAARRLVRLLSADASNVARDPMLMLAAGMSLLPAPLLALTRPMLDAAALSAFGVVGLSTLLVPIALVLPAALVGWVTGFLLLEDRDEGMLLALDTTPVGKSGFLAYRVGISAGITALIALYVCVLLAPGLDIARVVFLALLVAMEGAASAIILPAIARNKVEGLALTKLTNMVAVVPLIALIPSPFRYAAGIVPSYWVGELLGLSGGYALPMWLMSVVALLVHGTVLIFVFGLFKRRAG